MSIVKSLLLGSAAGLVAVASAQAADLPAKAKAVDYVKVCDAYGAGFYYIPGTDICLKVGGYLRVDYYSNYADGATAPIWLSGTSSSASPTSHPNIRQGGNASYDREDDLFSIRARAAVDLDARTRTEYGTLRSYGRFYVTNDATGNGSNPNANGAVLSASMDRAFIQFAGFTFGYVQSFFDYSTGLGTFATANVGSNKINNTLAYTASLGNGLSATIGIEDAYNRRNSIQGAAGVVTTWVNPTFDQFSYNDVNNQGGMAMPDIVANIRVDQSWGSAQLSGAIHQLRADTDWTAVQPAAFSANDTDYGYAIGAGVTFNLDSFAKGDQFMIQGSYADGAIEYTGVSGKNQNSGASGLAIVRGSQGVIVDLADAFINPATGSIDTVSAWTIRADFRHFWTPTLRSTLFGGYTSVDVPNIDGITAGTVTGLTAAATAATQTVRDFNLWQLGFNTTWSPVKNLDVGLELLYTKIDANGYKNYVAGDLGLSAAQADYANSYSHDDDIFSGMVRVQRNF